MPFIGIGVGIGRQRFAGGGGGGFDADYQAVLDYATTQGYTLPSAGQQALQNQLVVDLKDGGIWSKLDTFGVFATDGDSDFALIDWIRLTDYTAVNSPTFTTNQGFTGDGVSAYIDTNFNPSTSGVNYTLNNASRGIHVVNAGNGLGLDGTLNTGSNLANRMLGGNSSIQSINQGNSALNAAVDLSGIGFKTIIRTSSSNVELFNETTQFSRTRVSSIIENFNQVVFRNGAGNFSTALVSNYYMGGNTVAEYLAMRTAYLNYFNAL
jgi:hypothetical protein